MTTEHKEPMSDEEFAKGVWLSDKITEGNHEIVSMTLETWREKMKFVSELREANMLRTAELRIAIKGIEGLRLMVKRIEQETVEKIVAFFGESAGATPQWYTDEIVDTIRREFLSPKVTEDTKPPEVNVSDWADLP